MRSILKNFGITTGIYLFYIPLMAFVSYTIFNDFCMNYLSSTFAFIVSIVALLGLNIGLLVVLVLILKDRFNYSIKYYISAGFLAIIAGSWMVVVANEIKNAHCYTIETSLCFDSIYHSKLQMMFLIFLVFYYILFIIINRMFYKGE